MTNSTDFSIALIGLRVQARHFGIDANTEAMHLFLNHTAEVMSQTHAMWRKEAYHKRKLAEELHVAKTQIES